MAGLSWCSGDFCRTFCVCPLSQCRRGLRTQCPLLHSTTPKCTPTEFTHRPTGDVGAFKADYSCKFFHLIYSLTFELSASEGVSRPTGSGLLGVHFQISEMVFADPVSSDSQSEGEYGSSRRSLTQLDRSTGQPLAARLVYYEERDLPTGTRASHS